MDAPNRANLPRPFCEGLPGADPHLYSLGSTFAFRRTLSSQELDIFVADSQLTKVNRVVAGLQGQKEY